MSSAPFPQLIIKPYTVYSLEGWEKIKVWINSRNDPSASMYEQNQEYLLRVPEVAHYHFSSGCSKVTAHSLPGVPPHKVEHYYYIFVLSVIYQLAGHQAFHASGVLGTKGVIAFCGDSYAGKSTLAYSMVRHGYKLWADDVVLFSASQEGVTSLKLPCDIKLRKESALYFDSSGIPLTADTTDINRPVRSLFLLHRNSKPRVEITRLPPVESFLQVLEHAHSFKGSDLATKERMVKAYLELTARSSVYLLSFPTGLNYIPEIIREIEAVLG